MDAREAVTVAAAAAQEAGKIMRRHLLRPKVINEAHAHDLKLELDVRCQHLIERRLRRKYPAVAVVGEEGTAGDSAARWRWVVDPIDGTVNFAHGIPHASVAIALQTAEGEGVPAEAQYADGFHTMTGVVYDPFTDELFTACRGGPAFLNGRRIHASRRARLTEAVVALGFSKSQAILNQTLPQFARLVHRVRKIRILGSAALSLAYVAAGRLEVYLENGVRLWDIAAGGLLVECAGGRFACSPLPGTHRYRMLAENGLLGRQVRRLVGGL